MDVSKLLKKHHDEDEQDENDQLFKVPQARPATTGSSSRGRVARPESDALGFAPTASADSAPSNDTKMSSKLAKAMMIEFQPGTKIVYGSYIKFRSAQGWYLQIDRRSGMGTCVQQLSEATTFKVMNEDGDKNFGPVSFGDAVRLVIQDQEYTNSQGDVFDFALGSKMAVDLNGVSRTRMQDAVPTVIPSRVPYAGKIKAKARWTLVHPTKGYMEDCRDECLSHLSDVALETGWLRLTSIGRAEDQNVSVTLQQPQGTEERQSVKLKTDEGRLRQEDLRASNSTANSNRKSSRQEDEEEDRQRPDHRCQHAVERALGNARDVQGRRGDDRGK